MADLEKSVAIIFEGVDQMGAGVDSVTKRIDGIADGVQGATQPMADLTLGIAKFEAGLLAAGAAVTTFSVKLAGDFDSAFREVSTLIDEPTGALEGFKQEVLDYASQSTQSLENVNTALYNSISAGADYADSLELLRIAEQAAVAGKSDLNGALNTIQSSLNAYGAGLEDAEYYSDLLFTTVSKGVTTLPELGSSLSNVTGLAASAGVDFEELNAAIATLTFAGSPTSKAVTQIQAAISNIIKPTSQAATLADELGIQFNATALEAKGLQGVLQDAAEATGGSTEQMAQLFGSVEALNGVLTLSGPAAGKFAENIEAMANASGATEAAYDKMAGTVAQGTQKIQNAMTVALIGIGDPLLDEFGGIQEAIAEIFNAIGASVSGGQLKGFVDELEGLFGGIEDTLREVAANLPEALEEADFSSFFDGIEAIRQAVSNLFEGADLTSADGLVSVIETLGLGFEALAQYTAGAIEGIGPFLEQLATLTNWFLELDPAVFAAAGTIGGLAVALNTLASAATLVTGPIGSVFGKAGVIAKAAPLVTGLVGVLSGPVGLAAAVGIVGTALFKAGQDILGFNDEIDPATQAIIDQNRAIDEGRLVWDTIAQDWVAAGEAQETLTEQVQRWNRETQDAILGIDRQADARAREARMMEEVNAKYADYEGQVEAAWKNSESFRGEQEATAQALLDQVEALGSLGSSYQEVGDGIYEQVSNVGAFNEALEEAKAALDEGLITEEQFAKVEEAINAQKTGAESAAEAQGKIADAALTSEEAILKARDAVLEQEFALEELASNERIKKMEFEASINVAELEADAKKVTAVLEATSKTIGDMGEAVTGLTGIWANADRFDQLSIERTIDQQLEIQREAADQQSRLIDEQIKQLKAKTAAMKSGEGLITIQSDGLEPALEMIMWEIIEKVQMRANAEGAEFLLGI